jgi:hypothetical protein
MEHWRFALPAVVLVVGALALAACGGSDNNNGNPSPSPGATQQPATPSPGGPPLSDEEYLRVFCNGLNDYTNALNTATTTEAIAEVVRAYVAAMRQVTPPADVREFHAAYVKYLEDAVDDPTSLVVTPPPKPADTVRRRLAEKQRDVAECKFPTFLNDTQ